MTGGGSCEQEGEGDSHTACTRVTQCHVCSMCALNVCGKCAVGMSAVCSGRCGKGRCGRGCWAG